MLEERTVVETGVVIVGAGPAGLMLSHLLSRAGIDTVVVEKRSREEIANTHRAGILEAGTVAMLTGSGVDGRVLSHGHEHEGTVLRFEGESRRIDFQELVGESVWLYPQNEIFTDLAAARERDGGVVHWEVTDTAVQDLTTEHPGVRCTTADGRQLEIRAPARGCGRFQGRVPAPDPRGRAHRQLHRVPLRVVRDPVRSAAVGPGADLRALAPRLRADLPAQRHRAAHVLPVRPGHGRRGLGRRADLGRAAAPRGRDRTGSPCSGGGSSTGRSCRSARTCASRCATGTCSWWGTPGTPCRPPGPRA